MEHNDFLFLEMTRYLSQEKYLLTCIEICFFTNAARYRHFLIFEVFLLDLLTSRPSTSTSKSERSELQRGREATERATKKKKFKGLLESLCSCLSDVLSV